VVIKEALDMMGIKAGPARSPAGPMSEERRKELKVLLKDMGVL